MAPFEGSISQREVQWVRLSSSCTYNKICYFRRTKSVVSLSHLISIIGQFLIISAQNRYDKLQDQNVPGYPDARVDASNLLSSLAFGTSWDKSLPRSE
ncbi:similar to An08g11010 [Aspergillus luchuensis]|uniref:Similar to An08g11010 n=1 Tax=Aspergillus kawachii TaxID=1069201 RepID=A0A146FAW8_ASPKA|nr:similar to An08g11010 [Aspergillus luchuensis]